jgi:catechol 2,3-dioxygenase-like lactoylglutathione lyase family enzyme
MKIKRIVANVKASNLERAQAFYGDVLGMDLQMDLDWIRTYGTSTKMQPQISFLSEGGSGAPSPDMSIEVDDLAEALERIQCAGIQVEYGPVEEPWGVKRFFVRDPFGRLLNIMAHA